MTRRSFRKPVIVLSLFPFLAVLVCTMGALIVLLVTVLQKARSDAKDVAESQSNQPQAGAEQLADLQLEKEDFEWRRTELERQRNEYREQLVRQRLTLSHFEDHIRRLEEQWKQLTAQAEELKRLGSEQSDQTSDTQGKLRTLRDEIDRQRKHLEAAKATAAGRQRAFAIIPYDGPNGTKRRPIYIECTDQGIVLQPEGVVLAPSDFEGSLGPGNPLDAALRTTREYRARYAAGPAAEEPYPLLVVRPSGTVAYAVARAAIKSWDDEFGYELIESDLQLAYPKADPNLKAELERSIADARQRQVVLASMMPGRFKQAGTSGLVATTNGGFAVLGGSAAGTGTAAGTHGGGQSLHGASFTRTFQDLTGDTQGQSHTMAGAHPSGSHFQGGRTGAGTGTGTGTGPGKSSSAASANKGTASGTSNGTSATGEGHPGAASSSAGSPSASGSASASGKPGGASATASGGSSNGPSGRKGSGGAAPHGMQPLANSRGADWGLPSRGVTGIQRHLQVECHADRLVLLQDRGEYRAPAVIPMSGETAAAVEPFVQETWKRMEQWGIAGDNCFWKPVLRVQVGPGAEQRFAEFATLLDGSGMVVERK